MIIARDLSIEAGIRVLISDASFSLQPGDKVGLVGPNGSGKTTLCLHAIAEAQRLGGTAAIIDVEHALDPTYAAVCGVDVDELYISQPDTGEEALEIAETSQLEVGLLQTGHQRRRRPRVGRWLSPFTAAGRMPKR